MEWEILYALCKQYSDNVVSGLVDIYLERAYIEDGHLKLTMSNGITIDVGNIGIIDDSISSTDYAYSSKKIDNLVYKIDEDILTKENKTNISHSSETVSECELKDYVRAIYGEVTSMTLTLPSTTADDYISSIVFTSGVTPTNLVYPDTIKMIGEGCIDGVFTPAANKRYEVIVSYDGANIVGVVGGYAI